MFPFAGRVYGKIADIRNSMYDRGVLGSYSLGARTISIGNITTGGTGKTPLVAYVAELLAHAGEKVCILTRGYGRENARNRVLVSDGESLLVGARDGGDEPVELAQKLLGKAIVVADANRVSSAAWAKEKFGPTVFLLDDAFQHRRARRDLDIVCIDATNPFGGELMLPAGRLREPLKNLARADAIVITRSDLVESVDAIRIRIQEARQGVPIFTSRTDIRRVGQLHDFAKAMSINDSTTPDWYRLRQHSDDEQVRSLAFCALGNPKAFFTQLSAAFDDESMSDEFDLTVIKEFPDHHRYSQDDISSLEETARRAGVHVLLTTPKDAVKLLDLNFELPCYVIEVSVRLDDDASFRKLITSS